VGNALYWIERFGIESAVKRGKGKIIRRKVAGHPVKNDVQPGGVRGVDIRCMSTAIRARDITRTGIP
jgi:hypothetical protein